MRPFRTSLAFMILAGFLTTTVPGCGGGSMEKPPASVDPSKPLDPNEMMPGYKEDPARTKK